MKSLLTFTLAAGVAITTGTVAQAAGTTKGIQNSDANAKTSANSPVVSGTRMRTVDRTLLSTELSKFMTQLEPIETDEEGSIAPARKKEGAAIWTF